MAPLNSTVGMIYTISADTTPAEKELRRFDTETDKVTGSVNRLAESTNKTSAAFASFAGNLAADVFQNVISGAKDAAAAILNYSAKMEQTKIGFASLLGNTEKASKLLKELQEFSKSTPFEFQGLLPIAQRLLGANVELEKIIPLMRDLGNVVAATGDTSIERLEGIGVALTQIISKGRVSAEEMEQLAERGIPAWKVLAETIGKSVAETRKLAEDGAINADIMTAALQKMSREKYGDAMEKQSRTFTGATTKIKDSLLIVASEAFKPFYEQVTNLSVRFAADINKQGNDFNKIGESIAKYIGEGLGAGLSYVAENLGKWFVQKIVDTITLNWKGVGFLGIPLLQGVAEGLGLTTPAPKNTSIADLRKADDSNNRTASPTSITLPESEKEIEKRRKEREELLKAELKARIDLLKNHLQDAESLFTKNIDKAREQFKEASNVDIFAKTVDSAMFLYTGEANQILLALNELEEQQTLKEKKAASEHQLVFEEQGRRVSELQEKIQKATDKNNELITETQKKESEKRVKISEAEANRKIEIEKSSSATALAERELALKQGQITELQFVRATNNIKLNALNAEKSLLESITQTDENRAEIKHKIALLDAQIAQARVNFASQVVEAINRETEAEKEKLKVLLEQQTASDPNGDTTGGAGIQGEPEGFEGGLIGGMMGALDEGIVKLTDFKNVTQSIGQTVAGVFLQMGQAAGQMVQQWVLMGNASDFSMKKMVASTLAGVAAQSITLAVFHTAMGIAALTPWGAALYGSPTLHFKAAAVWAGIGIATAGLGRITAGNSFNQQSATGSNNPTTNNGSGSNGGPGTNPRDQVRTIEEDRLRFNNSSETVRHEIDYTDSNGRRRQFLINTIKDDVNSQGDLRDLIGKLVNEF